MLRRERLTEMMFWNCGPLSRRCLKSVQTRRTALSPCMKASCVLWIIPIPTPAIPYFTAAIHPPSSFKVEPHVTGVTAVTLLQDMLWLKFSSLESKLLDHCRRWWSERLGNSLNFGRTVIFLRDGVSENTTMAYCWNRGHSRHVQINQFCNRDILNFSFCTSCYQDYHLGSGLSNSCDVLWEWLRLARTY